MKEYERFERQVADLFRGAGAFVQHDVEVGGHQIDVLVNFRSGGIDVRIAVECKYYSKRISIDLVDKFSNKVNLMRSENLIDLGAMVSRLGFSREARKASERRPIRLLVPEDIVGGSDFGGKPFATSAYGAEVFTIMDAIDADQFNDSIKEFFRCAHTVIRARKYAPIVSEEYIKEISDQCIQLSEGLGPSYRIGALLLEGIRLFDVKDYDESHKYFEQSLRTSEKEKIIPLINYSLSWLARTFAYKDQFDQAFESIDRALAQSPNEIKNDSWKVKAQYWKARIHWLAHVEGKGRMPLGGIRQLFEEAMSDANRLGIMNYVEGARARIGEIELFCGNAKEALRNFLLSERLTPYPQDQEKLRGLIAKAQKKLSPAEIVSVEKQVLDGSSKPFRVKVPSITVHYCEYGVWRFAKFHRDRIIPYVFQNDWHDRIIQLIEDDELLSYCISVDRYQRKHDGVLVDVGDKKYRSFRAQLRSKGADTYSKDILRRLIMCRRIFATSALIADTGKNGSVALVPLTDSAEGKILEYSSGDWFIDKEKKGFGYFMTTKKRLKYDYSFYTTIEKSISKLINSLISLSSTHGVFPFSIDFLFDGDKFYILEIHYPSRGFEILYAPFRNMVKDTYFPIDIYANLISELAGYINANTVLLAHLDKLRDDSDRHRSEFYSFEFSHITDEINRRIGPTKLITVQNWMDTTRRKGFIDYRDITPDIVVLDDIDPLEPIRGKHPQILLPNYDLVKHLSDRVLFKRQCEKYGLPTLPWLHIKSYSEINIEEIIKRLGQIIVVKDRYHLPSWHNEKRRSYFIDLRDPYDQKRLICRSKTSEIIIEKLHLDSIDMFGHCGELRVHACVMY